jgi:hypothetical protein
VSNTFFSLTSTVRVASLMQIVGCAHSLLSRSIFSIRDISFRIIRCSRMSRARDCGRICMRSRRSIVLSPRVPWRTRLRLGSLDLALPCVQGVLVGKTGGSGFRTYVDTEQIDRTAVTNSPSKIDGSSGDHSVHRTHQFWGRSHKSEMLHQDANNNIFVLLTLLISDLGSAHSLASV